MKYRMAFALSVLLIMGSVAEVLRPNIVYFLIDDQGYADVGFNGSPTIKTPNMDKLAAAGTILTSHYAQPVCSPTRAALMTGRYPIHTGVYNVVSRPSSWALPLEERTLAQGLRDAGYVTAICGKWHLGLEKPELRPTKRGFDYQYGQLTGAIDSYTKMSNEGLKGRDWFRNDAPCADEGYATHQLAQEACKIIGEQPSGKPLFLYVPFNAVHTPYQAPATYEKPYASLDKATKSYAAMTAALDEAIGQIVAAMEKKGLGKNTLFIYSSDNGGTSWGTAGSNAPLRGGKADIYEGGVRVCSFVTWPGHIPAGVKNDEPVHIIDWYPTLLKLAGASLDQPLPVDGKDLWPMLTQGAKSPHEEILIIGSVPGQRAIRMGDWKLLLNPWDREKEGKGKGNSGRVELYDLRKDIAETTNLADTYPERVQQMRNRLDALTVNPANPDGFFHAKKAKGDQSK